jgi:ATP-binding cassette, subfamily B, multidrug efflux pump
MSMLRLIWQRLRPFRRLALLSLLLQTAAAAATLTLPLLYARVIDSGVLAGRTGEIWSSGALMVAVTLGAVVCSILAVRVGTRIAMAVGRDLRREIFEKVQSFSAAEIEQLQVSSLITRSTGDVLQVQTFVLTLFNTTVTAPITGIGGVVLALRQDVELTAVLAVVLPVLALVAGWVVWRLNPLFRFQQRQVDVVNQIVREQIAGARVIRAFVRDDLERERFGRANDDVTSVAVRIGRLLPLMSQLVLIVINVSTVVVFWFGALRIESGAMSVGALLALVSYLLQILSATFILINLFIMAPRAQVSAERIAEVLETRSGLDAPAEPVTRLSGRPGLELTDVTWRHPGAQAAVLQDVSLLLEPGTVTAVVGATGSGKSALIGLLCRLYDPTSGTVTVGGTDVRRLDPALLARTVGLVPQRPFLLSGSIADNLRYGRHDATDEELWHALDVAQAGFVADLPGGLESPVDQGGTNFSGGQRQRIAIARALLVRPRVFLFDDSFSALDYATDVRVRAALAAEIGDATVVMVAQRVSTIRDADRIVVLDAGRVAGVGRHDELLAGNDIYQEIVRSQPSREVMDA